MGTNGPGLIHAALTESFFGLKQEGRSLIVEQEYYSWCRKQNDKQPILKIQYSRGRITALIERIVEKKSVVISIYANFPHKPRLCEGSI